MNFDESINYLFSLGHEVLAAKYGLEGISTLLQSLGDPHLSFDSVLVAGTNGKGSICAMLDSIARESGLRTGLYTSPHLIRIQERIRVAGSDISQTHFARLASRVRQAAETLVAQNKLAAPPTFFEQVTAIAFCWFAEQAVSLAILEVGLGGRLDATNVVQPMVSVLASIDFDHQNLLGTTIEEIAAEKAAIIKPGAGAVIGRQPHNDAVEVFMRRCLEADVLPAFVNEPAVIAVSEQGLVTLDYESAQSTYTGVSAGLRGRHQQYNAAAAIETAEALQQRGKAISREAILTGLRLVKWPGRLELIDDRPPILLDGAHNAAGARALRSYLDEFCRVPITLVFGAMKDKDIEAISRELFDAAKTIVLTKVRDPRAATGPLLAGPALVGSSNIIFTETVRQALSWARSVTPPDGLVCVAGSLHLVGEMKRLLEEEESQGAVV
jgi:dihydrofolate synthase/folylpolyglutamate synthase